MLEYERMIDDIPENAREEIVSAIRDEEREYTKKIDSVEKAIRLVAEDRDALYCVPPEFRTPEFIAGAVKYNGAALGFADRQDITVQMCLDAVQSDPVALRAYVPNEYKFITPEVCLAAVSYNARMLIYVPEIHKTEEVCLAAVRRNGWVIRDVPENLRTLELCIESSRKCGKVTKYVPRHLRAQVEAAIQENTATITITGDEND